MAKEVYAHLMPSAPIRLDDVDPRGNPGDYYKRNYINPAGESGIHANYGGMMRDAPAIRNITMPYGTGWELDDAREDVRRAKAHGITGFAIDLLNLSGSANHTRTKYYCQAAQEDGTFKIALIADMTSLTSITAANLANELLILANYTSVKKISDGRLLVMAFQPQNRDNAFWTSTFQAMHSQGTAVAFLPIPTGGLSTAVMDQFDTFTTTSNSLTSSTWGYGWWGGRNPGSTAGFSGVAAAMRARTGNSNKRVFAPVSYGDARPGRPGGTDQIWDESYGSKNLRDSWDQAIAACTFSDDMVQLITWNDYVENSVFSPTRRRVGNAYMEISERYMSKLQTGVFPTASVDSASIFYRNQILPTQVQLSAALAEGVAITALPVVALTAANRPTSGDSLSFFTGQAVTVSATPAVGATSIAINSFVPRVGKQVTLSAALASGTARTTLPVTAIDTAISSGQVLVFRNGQTATVSAAVAVNATSIPINSFTPSATIASGDQVSRQGTGYYINEACIKMNWTYRPASPAAYKPMINRKNAPGTRGGSTGATAPDNIVEFYTDLTAAADAFITVGGVETTYSAPAGPNVNVVQAAVGASPKIVLKRSGVTILTVEGNEAVSATPYVQDVSYNAAYGENPPAAVVVDTGAPAAWTIRQKMDTLARLTTFNPMIKSGEICFIQTAANQPPIAFVVGPGLFTDLLSLSLYKVVPDRPVPNVQTFLANGTWTKPTGDYKFTRVILQAPGAPGGSGRRGAAGTVRCGGGAGGGGGRAERTIPFDALGATEAVVIPAVAAGGAAVTTDDTNGNNGAALAGASSFGSFVRVGVSNPGNGGTNAAGAGGTAGQGQFTGGPGGAAGTTGGAGTAGASAADAGAGGGPGGGLTTGNAAVAGTAGAGISAVLLAAATGGTNGGAAPVTVDQPVNSGLPAPGGGGGGSSASAAGQAGANGGRYGGGGGGGSASVNGQPSGKGGDGGPGICLAFSY